MLSANSGEGIVDFFDLWEKQRAAALAALASPGVVWRTGTRPTGAPVIARLAARRAVPVVPNLGVVPGTVIDDVPVATGDIVLLVAQLDARENGLYRANRGREGAFSDLYVGMQVLVSHGGLCAGWMFVCVALDTGTGAVAFRPLLSPGPTQVDDDDASLGHLMVVPEGQRIRALSVQGWRDAVTKHLRSFSGAGAWP